MSNNNRRDFLKHSGLLLGGLLLSGGRIFGRESTALAGLQPFLGEIGIFAFNFAPKGWALCNGQLLPINQNQGLFSLLGTTYGGNGQTNFALPDLQGRVPIHSGAGHILGERLGEQSHQLIIQEIPIHLHAGETGPLPISVGGTADTSSPVGALPGKNSSYPTRFANSSDEMMELAIPSADNNTMIGGNQAHPNMQPFLVLNFCIALQGIFPSQN